MTINFELIAGKITTNLTGGQLKQISHFDHLKKQIYSNFDAFEMGAESETIELCAFLRICFGIIDNC